MLPEDVYAELDRRLGPVDAARAAAYPGERADRQPVRTCYMAADAVVPGLAAAWGAAVLDGAGRGRLPGEGCSGAARTR
jgi:hypothetical protein